MDANNRRASGNSAVDIVNSRKDLAVRRRSCSLSVLTNFCIISYGLLKETSCSLVTEQLKSCQEWGN
jgi:hypothetical protein